MLQLVLVNLMSGVCSEVILKFRYSDLFIWNEISLFRPFYLERRWYKMVWLENLSFLSKHSTSQNKIFKSLLKEGEIHGGIFPLNNNIYFSAPVSG